MKSLSAKWYLSAISLSIVLAGYAQYLWQYNFQDLPLLKAQPPGVSLLLIGVASAFVFWLFAPWKINADKWLKLAIGLLVLTWAIVLITSRIHEDLFTHGVWTYTPILLMLTLKSPTFDQTRFAIVFTGWLLVGVLVLTRILEITGAIDIAFIGQGMIAYEPQHYWLPFAGWLGPEYRWPGPMGHNAMTGVVGVYLLIIGVAIRGKTGISFAIVGVLTILLTSSRVSFVAAAIGVTIVLFLGTNRLSRKVSWLKRSLFVVVIAALSAGFALIVSPNLTGRTSYWPAFFELWLDSPWIGAGKTGKALGDSSISGTNAHNIFLDTLALYGVLPLLTMTAALALLLFICVRAAKAGHVLPLAIVTAFLVIGLTQADHGWIEPSEPWWLLVLAAFMASAVNIRAVSVSEKISERP
jgi:O-antigen ligase